MPDKPLWFGRLGEVISQLNALPSPWIDRAQLEAILEVGARRTQQVMKPLVGRVVGRSHLVERGELIHHLQQIAAGEAAHYEQQRRSRLAQVLQKSHEDQLSGSHLLVEAPVEVLRQTLVDLPEGIRLAPGQITVQFTNPEEALQKLVTLAMAIGNQYERFAEAVSPGMTSSDRNHADRDEL